MVSSYASPPILRRLRLALLAGVACLAAAPALALDGQPANGPDKLLVAPYADARQALDAGLTDLAAGDTKGSLKALNYAADGGEPLAMWKLGRMYSRGEDGVQRDDLQAYRYFDALVRGFDEDKIDARSLGAVVNGFIALAQYQLTGIPGSDVRADPEHALTLLQFAATNFKSTEAQFGLGNLYLNGAGAIAKDPVRAARWLALAASKGHKGAQATFGHLLFAGLGVPVQRARGLRWEMQAKAGAQPAKDDWIREGFARDWAQAGEDDREMALAYLGDAKPDDPTALAAKPGVPMSLLPPAAMAAAPPLRAGAAALATEAK